MTLYGSLTFFIAIFIFGITPGPGIFAILARALTQGARACTLLALGMAMSDIVYLVLACFSLAALATHYSEVFTVIRWAGAAYLVYLGWKMWTAPIDTDFEQSKGAPTRGWQSLVQGMVISASNPKVILFYIAFLPTFMDLNALSGGDIVLACVLTLAALMAGLMSIAWGAARVRLYIRSVKAMCRLNRTAGSIMIGAGALLASKS